MKTDITRSMFKREKHYSGVRMQQGRVQLDADWNEQLDIQAYLDQSTRRDVIGLTGTRQDDEGFEIRLQDASLWIGKGHYYVDGILCENEQEIALSEQPDVPVFDLPTGAGFYLAYVDVWQRSITALDDSSIREVALGGPDTTTRTKTVWQVRLLQAEKSASCSGYGQAWTPPGSASSGKLRAWAKVSEDVEDDCLVPAGAAYRRRENQLYRVEIHAGSEVAGGPTFKWSRDNGSIVFRLELEDGEIKSDVITVSKVGQGKLRALQPGQWVELGDEERALRGELGVLVELDSVEGGKLTVKSWPGGSPPILKTNPTVRCWDSPGALSVASGTSPKSLELEDGVQVQFEAGGEYRTGDYWMIPARTALRDVEWPLDRAKEPPEPIFKARHGIHHHYAPLALLELTSGGKWQVARDCRQRFPALTDLISMFYIGGDGQEAMPDSADPTKLVPLEEPLRVGVTNGQWPVQGARIKFEFVGAKGALSGSRNGSDEYVVKAADGYVIVATDGDGVAQCKWELDGGTPAQQVKATLLDDTDQATHLPVYFGANLSLASQVAYDSSGCLNPAHPTNVQDALDQLCHNAALYYVGGDGQEAMPGEWLPGPLKVRVANGQWPVKGASVVFSIVEPGEGGLRKVGGRRVNRRKLEVKTDEHGLAACEWQPDEVNPSQRVKASLAGTDDLPIHFTANLSRASEVAYAPGSAREPGRLEGVRVVPSELGPEREGERYTVQDALDTLFATKVNRAGDTLTGSLTIEEDLHVNGNVEVDGTVKAERFEGDGSGLHGLPAGQWMAGEEGSVYYDKGNVGIGTEKPQEQLDVDGNIKASGRITGRGGLEVMVPKGAIVMWSGKIDDNRPIVDDEPDDNWRLCDGETYDSVRTPDLRDRFIVGSGGEYEMGQTGGDEFVALNTDEMPSHNHDVSIAFKEGGDGKHRHTINTLGGAVHPSGGDNRCWDDGNQPVHATNVDGAHKHEVDVSQQNVGSGSAHENRPPYYALAYIMRVA
jgi:microcystin-dependent protein